ncbi:MAG: CBS domain-containing protein [Parvularculaceae bacterium]
MFVSDILKNKGADVFAVSGGKTVRSVLSILQEKNIGALIVGDGGKPSGILSERDIVHLLAKEGAEALDRSVESVMTRKVVTCSPSDTIDSVMTKMTRGRFRHVPVVDESGALVGLVSIGDIVKHRIAETEKEAEALKQYIAT